MRATDVRSVVESKSTQKERANWERKKKRSRVESDERMETSPGVPKDWLQHRNWRTNLPLCPTLCKCHLRRNQCTMSPPPLSLSLSPSFETIAILSLIPKIQVPICNRFYVNWIPCWLLCDKTAFFVPVAVASRKCAQMALMLTRSYVFSTWRLCCAFSIICHSYFRFHTSFVCFTLFSRHFLPFHSFSSSFISILHLFISFLIDIKSLKSSNKTN